MMAADARTPQPAAAPDVPAPSAQPAGLEAPAAPTADPAHKTDSTHDPAATDPGNGAD